MDWLGLFWVLFFLLAFILGISYISTADMMGHEVAQRTIRLTLILFLLLIPLGFLLYLLGDYGLVGFQIFVAVTVIISLLSWPFRKQKAGILLLDIGKNEDLWVAQVGLGLAYSAFVGHNAWSFFRQASTGNLQYASLVTKGVDFALWFSLGILWIFQGFSKTEFRTNGICTYFRFISWRRMKSYNWEPSKPNILTIRYKPRFPLFPTWMSWPIPIRYKEALNQILNERLQDKSL
jgi:hypothetical protein